MENETKELGLLKVEVSELEKQAIKSEITTPEQNVLVTALKAKLKEIGKRIKERKEKITKPLNEALRSARSLFAPIEAQYEAADIIVGRKLLDYKQKIEAENMANEAKIAARVEKGTMRLDTAEKKIEAMPQIQKMTNTEHGRVQFRKIKKIRITNENLLPEKYWVIDMVELRKDALNTPYIQIAGCEVYEEETV